MPLSVLALVVAGEAWREERVRRVLDAHQRGLRAFHIVAGNRHDVHGLAAEAKAQGLDPRAVLRSSVLARAFTAHQLAALIEDTLPLLMADRLGFAAVVDPLDQYAGEDVTWEEGSALLQRGLAKLRLLARRRPDVPLLIVQHPRTGTAKHWDLLVGAADSVVLVQPAVTSPQRALTAWLPPAPSPQPEVMPLGPHPAHVPQPA